ncbi:MAG: family 43 glycosylhydrolase [Clostridia bacterium]
MEKDYLTANDYSVEKISKCFQAVYEPEGRYVNDHCFVMNGDTMHLFYIDGEIGKGCYDIGNETIIGHASSRDLMHWKQHPPALVYDQSLQHEKRGIFAPYVAKKEGMFHMFYSSHNMEKAQFICLAFSEDLFNWERSVGNPVLVPDKRQFLWDESIPCSCRDPHIHREEIDGIYYMYWVADMRSEDEHSCIAVAVSSDLKRFRRQKPVIVKRHSFDEAYTMKTESPCLIARHGLYYLFYRHGDGTKYCISDKPDDFKGRQSYLLGPSHAGEIFEFKGSWYISSCSREPNDLGHITDRTKGLYLARLSFESVHPKIIAF